MPELPESVPKGPFYAACALAFLGFVAIVFAGGNALVMWVGSLLVLAALGIGAKLGLDLWKATE
jgi:hypothetical protein